MKEEEQKTIVDEQVEAQLKGKVEEMSEGKAKNDIAREEVEKIRAINDALEKEILRNEELRARQLLGGKTTAGQNVDKTPEDLAKEEAVRLLGIFK